MVVSTCNTEPKEITFVTTNNKMINYKDDWIINSGCSNHMTGDKEMFVSISKYKRGRVITTNNLECPITHISKVVVSPQFSNKQVQLDNVYYILGMTKNLLSVSQQTTSGNYLFFGPRDVMVY